MIVVNELIFWRHVVFEHCRERLDHLATIVFEDYRQLLDLLETHYMWSQSSTTWSTGNIMHWTLLSTTYFGDIICDDHRCQRLYWSVSMNLYLYSIVSLNVWNMSLSNWK